MSIWYIDSECSSGNFSGTSPENPRRDFDTLEISAGDSVLLKRGTVYRSAIVSPSGTPECPIVWGAWGEGDNPVILGSVKADCWEKVSANIWKWQGFDEGEVCNLIFDNGFGTLRWDMDSLSENGDFYYTAYQSKDVGGGELYLYCDKNPSENWESIEVACFKKRNLATAVHDVVFEDITFKNSGVHGFAATNSARITIRRCKFHNIGGCVWDAENKVRFGNGVEFWNECEDILVTECDFNQIYDSALTHQGQKNGEYKTPKNIVFSFNTIANCGMAAYEIRDKIPLSSRFHHNLCDMAGMGFSAQGDVRPRRWVLWPEPMGHHLFIWRMDKPTDGGELLIDENTFGYAFDGYAEYSIVSPEAQAQIIYRKNIVTCERPVLRQGKKLGAEALI